MKECFRTVLLKPVEGMRDRWSGYVPSGKVVGTSPSCSRAMARGLEKRVLDVVNARPLAGAGCGSFCRGPLHWIHGWGLPMGSIPPEAHW